MRLRALDAMQFNTKHSIALRLLLQMPTAAQAKCANATFKCASSQWQRTQQPAQHNPTTMNQKKIIVIFLAEWSLNVTQAGAGDDRKISLWTYIFIQRFVWNAKQIYIHKSEIKCFGVAAMWWVWLLVTGWQTNVMAVADSASRRFGSGHQILKSIRIALYIFHFLFGFRISTSTKFMW